MLIQAVVPTSVGIIVQYGNRMLAEASTTAFHSLNQHCPIEPLIPTDVQEVFCVKCCG